MAAKEFEWPWQYSFPPFFTPQPNLNTRKKQYEAWKSLILEYHKVHKQYVMDLTEAQSGPLFYNKSLGRKLNQEAIVQIIDELSQQGNAEWIDKQRCYIFWRTPEEWGAMIYKWAEQNGVTNTVCTLFELVQGDDTTDQEFFGLDTEVLKKALRTLETNGKAELIEDPENEGVKFF